MRDDWTTTIISIGPCCAIAALASESPPTHAVSGITSAVSSALWNYFYDLRPLPILVFLFSLQDSSDCTTILCRLQCDICWLSAAELKSLKWITITCEEQEVWVVRILTENKPGSAHRQRIVTSHSNWRGNSAGNLYINSVPFMD